MTVTGNVYDYAVPNTLSTPIDVGNIHAGGTFTSQTVSVQNLAPVSDYSESLAVSPETGIRLSSPAGPQI